MSYIVPESLPYSFCPGCGHGVGLNKLDEAMQSLNLDSRKTVIVTDIGCIGISDRHFRVNTFHGLHGRVITYATGLKLANPDLTVIALMGDGGAGIGGQHLLNAARRNVGITLLVFNNMNFGMTGGEHSVTTPFGFYTSSTPPPGGNLEMGMDLCSIAGAAGAGFVARGTVFDSDLSATIVKAISYEGFSIVDIWELCTAYFVPNNRFSKKGLMETLEKLNLKTGVLVHKEKMEYSRWYREAYESLRREGGKKHRGFEAKFTHALDKKIDFILAGGAGQKIRSSAGFLGYAAVLSGLWVTQRDDYPITVMTGHSISEMSLSPARILYVGITIPDFMIVVSPEGLKKVRTRIERMEKGSLLIIDSKLQPSGTEAEIISLPFSKEAEKVDRRSVALYAVTAFLKKTGIIPLEALKEAVSRTQKREFSKLNLKAIDAASSLI
ncbi:MAG: thiamine pyrophosphate-dependent enzyme [Acidobacteriota bacterium]